MIEIKSVKFTNFLSYGAVATEVRFDTPGTTLMVGKNGVGKTSIINALVYGLYDKPLSEKVIKDDLINNINKRRMQVFVEFSTKGKTYVVERARKMKAGPTGTYVRLKEDGEDITPDSVHNTNAKLHDIIGIDYELFVRIVTFAATHKPFLDLPVHSKQYANQTDIIEELFDLKTLSDKADILKEKIGDNERSLKTAERDIGYKKKERKRYDEQVSSAELRIARWQDRTETELDELLGLLREVETIDVDAEQKLLEKADKLNAQAKELKSQESEKMRAKNRGTKTVKELNKEIKHLESDECPYCLQKFANAEEKCKEMRDKRDKLDSEINEIATQLIEFKKKIERLESDARAAKREMTVRNLDELIETKSNIKQMETKVKELQVAKNPHLEELEDLKENKPTQIDMRRINKLTDDIFHQKFLWKILTKKDSFVRKALLDRNIPYLNKQLSFYLNELGLPFAVEFTHEMTAKITSFGNEVAFANMSAGQKSRINLALSFAFRDVLQNLHSKINVCMMDEVLDVGLDTEGIQIATSMLKNRALSEGLSMFVVSHKSEEIDAFERRMVIQMEDGFSTITYE